MSPEQRFTFDDVGELYDRQRPGYPEALFDELISLAELDAGERVLEIGCGTGQASVPVARRGLALLALEPGHNLAAIARRKLAAFPKARVLDGTFEDWQTEDAAFALVFSAQAFHWLEAETRFPKCAAALRPEGSLAVIGNAVVLDDSPLREAIDAAYRSHAPTIAGPPVTRWYAEEGPVEALFAESGCFGPVATRRYPWSQRYRTADYLDMLRTHSDHRLLGESAREALLAAIADTIESHGGSTEVAYEANLYLAHRLP